MKRGCSFDAFLQFQTTPVGLEISNGGIVLYAEIAGVIFYFVCLFQIALMCGAPWGEYTMGGQTTGKLPVQGRIAAGVSIIVLVVMAQALLAIHGSGLFVTAPTWLIEALKWFTFGYAILGFLMNWITRSKKERMVWGPVATVLVVLVSLAVFGN